MFRHASRKAFGGTSEVYVSRRFSVPEQNFVTDSLKLFKKMLVFCLNTVKIGTILQLSRSKLAPEQRDNRNMLAKSVTLLRSGT